MSPASNPRPSVGAPTPERWMRLACCKSRAHSGKWPCPPAASLFGRRGRGGPAPGKSDVGCEEMRRTPGMSALCHTPAAAGGCARGPCPTPSMPSSGSFARLSRRCACRSALIAAARSIAWRRLAAQSTAARLFVLVTDAIFLDTHGASRHGRSTREGPSWDMALVASDGAKASSVSERCMHCSTAAASGGDQHLGAKLKAEWAQQVASRTFRAAARSLRLAPVGASALCRTDAVPRPQPTNRAAGPPRSIARQPTPARLPKRSAGATTIRCFLDHCATRTSKAGTLALYGAPPAQIGALQA